MTSYNYLPQIPASALKQLFHQETQEEVNDFLSNYQYERLGLDRLMLILDDIKKYHTLPGSFLDIGCNNGLLPLFLGLFNNPAIGIFELVISAGTEGAAGRTVFYGFERVPSSISQETNRLCSASQRDASLANGICHER